MLVIYLVSEIAGPLIILGWNKVKGLGFRDCLVDVYVPYEYPFSDR